MISIIICSRKQDISFELQKNITETVGCEYEIVVIDNSKKKYSIFSAYNEGICRSCGEILCFMHEDILFHTDGWGQIVEQTVKNTNIGLVGVIGSQYKSAFCQPWWADFACIGQLIQGSIKSGKYKTDRCTHWERRNGDSDEVAILDGLWFCAKKELFSMILFDENTFSGFHMYDADICMQVHKIGFKVCVIYDLWIEHKSTGNPNEEFVSQLKLWFEKWRDYLPIYKGKLLENEVMIPEKVCSRWCKQRDEYHKKYTSVLKSKAYRIGKWILRPNFSNLQKMFCWEQNV